MKILFLRYHPTVDVLWGQLIKLAQVASTHRQENRRLVGHFYDMKNRFWAVGCGLGWAVGKKVWADYEQLLREVFSTFCRQKKRAKNATVST